MAGFIIPGRTPAGYTYPGTGGVTRPAQTAPIPTAPGATPYSGMGTPGTSPYVPEEAAVQRERESTRLGYGQQGDIAAAAREQEAKLQAEAEKRRFGQFSPYFQSLFGQIGAGGAGGVTLPRESYGGADAEAARQAAFARAKDQAAQIARASLSGLRNVMGERGISGSNIEALKSAGIIGDVGGVLGDVNREQLIHDLAAQQRGAEVQYEGGITQRGQDIQRELAQRQALMGLFNQMFGGDLTARY